MNQESVDESIKLAGSIQAITESDYLIISNKEKAQKLLVASALDENDIIDIFNSLHIVLEVSLNTLFRHISLFSIKKQVDEFEIIKNLDSISFIDKTVLFIYNSTFDFGDDLREASQYHAVIGTIKDFANMRNRLFHGHSISTIFDGATNRHSPLRKDINLKKLKEQVKKFRRILEGMRFYLNHLNSRVTPEGKESLIKSYLDDSFLPRLS